MLQLAIDREAAERAAMTARWWGVVLERTEEPVLSVETGVVALIDVYGALAKPPVVEWLRDPSTTGTHRPQFIGTPDVRGILVTETEGDFGNPRDGWPRSTDAATVGLDSLRIWGTLAHNMYMSRDEEVALDGHLCLWMQSTLPWPRQEAAWHALVDRFARLGYRDTTLTSSIRHGLYETLLALGGPALLGRYGVDETTARAAIEAAKPTPEQQAILDEFLKRGR